MEEVWKNVNTRNGIFIGEYEVSNMGFVRSCKSAKNKKILSPRPERKGYLCVHLYLNAKPYVGKIHRLVAEAFIGDRPDNMQINHMDGNKTNNCVSNLEYVSCKENIRHAFRVMEHRNSIVVRGERMSVPEAVDKFGVPGLTAHTVRARIYQYKWPVEAALLTPVRGK
jgi:hypothetical protein